MKEAQYKIQKVKDYTNNPLIEALPNYITDKKERSQLLVTRNTISESDLSESPEIRIAMLDSVDNIFIPMNWAIRTTRKLDRMIRKSYRRRNPLSNEYIRLAYNISVENLPDLENLEDPVGAYSILGCSGIGKTSTIRKFLKRYDQVIHHTSYKGIPLNLTQIVYLWVDAPDSGSVAGFCLNMLSEIDRLTGKNYSEENKRSRIPVLEREVAKYCAYYNVGLIIVDECQNLLLNTYGKQKLSGFLTNLMNKVGAAFCFIGTPAARDLFEKGPLHTERRLGKIGIKTLKPYAQDSKDWKMLMQVLWSDGLYIKAPDGLTAEVADALYEYSGGIPGFAKDLFKEVQEVVLDNEDEEEERLTPELIREVGPEAFPYLAQDLEAIRNDNITYLMEKGDWFIETGFTKKQNKKAKKKKKVRSDGNQRHLIEDTVYELLVAIGYSEDFSKTELRKQARLIAQQIEPNTPKLEYTPLIMEYMKKLIDKKRESETVTITPESLEDDILHEF